MRIERTSNVRQGERHPFMGDVQISWQLRPGETTTVRAKCTDISEHGARIECAYPIEFRTNVYLQSPHHGMIGNATVRYCRRSGAKHILGLLFNAPPAEADEGRKRLIREELAGEK